MTIRKLIVVVGINGRQGSSVAEILLEHPDEWAIRGTTDDLASSYSQQLIERGVEMVLCDVSNQQECLKAFDGAYGVFSINKYWNATSQDEYEQVRTIVEAARIAKVQHFITSGIPDTTYVDKSQLDTPSHPISHTTLMEQYIRRLPQDSKFPHTTYIKIGFYYQNFLTFIGQGVDNLEFRYPYELNVRFPLYDVRDTGKIVQECFRQPERWGNEYLVPITTEYLTMTDVCTTLREVTGRNINFVPLSFDEARRRLLRETVNIMRWYNDIGDSDEQHINITKEICPNMKSFADWIREIEWLME